MFYDGHRFKSRLSTGLDIRGSVASNDKFGLIGFRTALQPRHKDGEHEFRPYAEMLVGGGTTTDVQSKANAHMFVEGVLGLDLMLGQFDFRMLEVGIGRTPLNNSTGASYSGGDLWEVTESSGLVYHF